MAERRGRRSLQFLYSCPTTNIAVSTLTERSRPFRFILLPTVSPHAERSRAFPTPARHPERSEGSPVRLIPCRYASPFNRGIPRKLGMTQLSDFCFYSTPLHIHGVSGATLPARYAYEKRTARLAVRFYLILLRGFPRFLPRWLPHARFGQGRLPWRRRKRSSGARPEWRGRRC